MTRTATLATSFTLIVALTGCPQGGSEASSETTVGDGDGDQDGESGDGDGDGDGNGDPVNPCADFDPAPSTENVTLLVTNQGDAPRYVITEGAQCPALGLERQEGAGYEEVNNHSWYTCPCECPALPGPAPRTLQLIESGATFELSWDGRRVHTCAGLTDCSSHGPDYGFEPDTFFALRPAEPGAYRVTLAYFDAPPPDCQSNEDGTYDCPEGIALFGPTACGAEASASVELVLGQGDVEGEILLP